MVKEKPLSHQQRNKRKNFLLLVNAVQSLYQKHKIEGLPDTIIYRKQIFPVYFVSLCTFRQYLAVNVRRELKALGFDPDNDLKEYFNK